MLQPQYFVTRTPKQLIYNYITTIPWKYNELIIKSDTLKNQRLYCNCMLVARETFIWFNVHIIYMVVVNHAGLFGKLHFSCV
jgi:hypothetical protein